MHRLLSLAWLLAACGGNGHGGDLFTDGGLLDDAAEVVPDAPPLHTPSACPVAHEVAAAATPDSSPAVPEGVAHAGCSPLAQTGCAVDEKCSWVQDQDNPPLGHVGCVPDGTIPVGSACTDPIAGPQGFDACAKGSVCTTGVCKQICDFQGGSPVCGAGRSCTKYAGLFETSGTYAAGVCDPSCNPLTQCRVGASPEACGSTNPSTPNSGCYGFDDFACAPIGTEQLTLTDRTVPRANSAGNPFLNGCAPGFVPLFYAMTGSTQVLCSGLCAALETDNTPAHKNNGLGDPGAPAKLPFDSMSYTGNATCAPGKKGSEATSRCVFMWPYLEDDSTGELPAEFVASGFLDTLGVCMAIGRFMIDTNADQVPDAPHPDCATLPPRSASTTGDSDDAADWGCQKRAHSNVARRAPAMRDAWIPSREAMTIERHVIE